MKNTTATITIHDDATASAYYPEYEQAANGAMDYSVTIEIGEITIEGEVTYYGDSQSVESGTPIDLWRCADLVGGERRRMLLDRAEDALYRARRLVR